MPEKIPEVQKIRRAIRASAAPAPRLEEESGDVLKRLLRVQLMALEETQSRNIEKIEDDPFL